MPDFRKEVKKRPCLKRFLGALLLFLTAFPYVQLIPTETYTQPFAFFLSSLLFFVYAKLSWQMPVSDKVAVIGLAILGVCTFILTCFPYENSQEYKYLLNYLSPLFVTVVIFGYLMQNSKSALYLIRLSVFAWIMVAVLQKFLDASFATFLIGQWSEHAIDILESGRGVLGLAPEPTHHAFHILILATCLALLDTSSRSRLLILLCVGDAIFLAASSSALLVIVVSAIVWVLLYRIRWMLILLPIAALGLIIGSSKYFFLGNSSRILSLVSLVCSDPTGVLSSDYSVNVRLGGMAAVVMDAFANFLIPRGMSVESWEASRQSILNNMPWLFDVSLAGPPSGIGLILFQTGALGALFICLIFRRVLTSQVGIYERILLIAMPLIFLSQYYISAPSFSLLYATALYRWREAKLGIVAAKLSCNTTLNVGERVPNRL